MFFTAAFALAAASLVMAQDVAINEATLTQCAQSTLSFAGTGGPYYVAVVPAENPCGSDAIAEFYDVTSQSVDYYAKIPAGTQVQVYVADQNNVADQNSGQEWWGGILTVGDGDAACLASDSASSSSAPASSSPTVYTPPAATGGSTYTPSSNSNSNGGSVANDDTPANAVQDTTPTGGASTITASTTLLVGAFAAAIALF